MVVLKSFMVAAVAFLLLFALLLLRREMQAVKARVHDGRRRQPSLRRLRQDPRTGVYYPED
jgi:hypothetical protein